MVIKAGSFNEALKSTPEKTYFLSKTTIPNLPSTKPRNRSKRDAVLAIEIEMLIRGFDKSKFPLAKIEGRKNRDDQSQ